MALLEGKVALVTGAGRGIGRGVAHLLSQHGAAVVVNDLGASLDGEGVDQGPAATVVQEIKDAGGEAVANTDSVADYQAAEAMVQQAIDTYGKLDILVNVAGILRDRMIFNMAEEEWDAVIDVHLKGTFNMSKWAAVHFRERRESGRIISMSSNSAFGAPGQPNYAAAKAGLNALTVGVAHALGPRVRVNAIMPGPFLTTISEAWDMDALAERTRTYPLRRAGLAEEIAGAALYLAGDGSSYTTGSILTVDGGAQWSMPGTGDAP